ncbi:hypothetical protein CONLIGDRAFT_637515 [Coniochaeta ligniaria NRRL 30616]|uniref:Uncharacterized protein n=1 Tax=Coniochaeta ligniaria NRRL 30616 TaxID=1408157 RepID=A0A1J7J7R6_9PEZI|nr:hypothetical protein CONLIGDRAFT_637515 [Coniochaeta ligniaria NRRL 30616]
MPHLELARPFSATATAILTRHVPSTTSRQLLSIVPTAIQHRLLLRSLAATSVHLRHLSQRPQAAEQTSPSTSATDGTAAQNSSAVKPKPQSTLDRLGATRTVKIVIIVFLCIYGTMEGIFYTTWLYRYFTNKSMEGDSK